MAAGLYIHIPFCFSKCPYCDFYSTKYTPTAADAFAEKLGGQMQDYTGSFDTVYFGGGTPSILEPQVLTGILQAVRDHFAIDPAAEITVECNPSKDLTGDMEQYAAAGINRVSIGMQSAVDRERFALGRRAGSGEVARTVAAGHGGQSPGSQGGRHYQYQPGCDAGHPQTDPGQLGGNLCLY